MLLHLNNNQCNGVNMAQKRKGPKPGTEDAQKRIRVTPLKKPVSPMVETPRSVSMTEFLHRLRRSGAKIASNKDLGDALKEGAPRFPTQTWREQVRYPAKGGEPGKPIEVTDESGKKWVLEPLDFGSFIIRPESPSQGEEKPSKEGSGQDKKSE
jgi:hypothetical protein